MSLCLVLPHIIAICDGKADCTEVVQKISKVFKVQVHHYMSLAHAHSDTLKIVLLIWEWNPQPAHSMGGWILNTPLQKIYLSVLSVP